MGSGFGMLAFAGLIGESLNVASLLAADQKSVDPRVTATGGLHHPARAKHVIFLFMNGGLFGFSMWLAGGGIKGGTVYGATDDFGFKAIEKPVHVHDLHATILHLMGIDHTKLTYRYSGRDFRLTDVSGTVIREVLA